MTQSSTEPDAQATGRWEDGRWVEHDEPSGEADAARPTVAESTDVQLVSRA